MKTYRLDESKFKRTWMRIVRINIIMALVVIVIYLWLLFQQKADLSAYYIIFLAVFLGITIFTTIRSIKSRKVFFRDYRLELNANHLVQSQPGYADLVIQRKEVTSVIDGKLGLYISTQKNANVLVITRDLPDADFQEIKAELLGWVSQANENDDQHEDGESEE